MPQVSITYSRIACKKGDFGVTNQAQWWKEPDLAWILKQGQKNPHLKFWLYVRVFRSMDEPADPSLQQDFSREGSPLDISDIKNARKYAIASIEAGAVMSSLSLFYQFSQYQTSSKLCYTEDYEGQSS